MPSLPGVLQPSASVRSRALSRREAGHRQGQAGGQAARMGAAALGTPGAPVLGRGPEAHGRPASFFYTSSESPVAEYLLSEETKTNAGTISTVISAEGAR